MDFPIAHDNTGSVWDVGGSIIRIATNAGLLNDNSMVRVTDLDESESAEGKTKTIQLYDREVGIYQIEVSGELQDFPHIANEAHVLGLTLLQEEDDDSFALGYEQPGGAVSPWFDDLEQLEQYCLQPGSRDEMRLKKSSLSS